MKKKKIIFIFLCLLIAVFPTFSATQKEAVAQAIKLKGTWVNTPFVKLLEQFGSLGETWAIVARDLAVILFVCNLVWQCIQMAFGTIETRKVLVSNITKVSFFCFIMCIYPTFTSILLKTSQQIAQMVSGNWTNNLGVNLQDYYNMLVEKVQKNTKESQLIIDLKDAKIRELQIEKGKMLAQLASSGIVTLNDGSGTVMWSREQVENHYKQLIEMAQLERENAKNANVGDVSYQTFAIIQSIFNVEKDGSGKCLAWKVALNTTFPITYNSLEIKDNGTNKYGKPKKKITGLIPTTENINIMSPDAILKSVYLCASIMWEREWSAVNQDWIANQEESQANAGPLSRILLRKFTFVDFPMHRVFEIIWCMILIMIMLICSCTAIIQYMMCILEYVLISGAAIILVPFMLFDGLTDMAQRVITTLLQQVVKLIFCVMMMSFVVWIFLELTQHTVASTTGLSLQNIIYGLFLSLIGGAFVTNAPKIAVALMSGTPQMSMGEFVQMAGAVAAAGRGVSAASGKAVHFVSKAGKMANKTAKAAAHAGVGTLQGLGRSWGSAKGAYTASKEAGGKAANKAVANGIQSFFGQSVADAGSSMKAGVKNWYNGTSGGGRGSSGGGGSSSYDNLNATGKNLTSTSFNGNNDYQTADAHNKNYGESLHYEKDKNGNPIATRKQTLGEHLKTQKDDAYQESLKRYRDYFAKKNADKEKK